MLRILWGRLDTWPTCPKSCPSRPREAGATWLHRFRLMTHDDPFWLYRTIYVTHVTAIILSIQKKNQLHYTIEL